MRTLALLSALLVLLPLAGCRPRPEEPVEVEPEVEEAFEVPPVEEGTAGPGRTPPYDDQQEGSEVPGVPEAEALGEEVESPPPEEPDGPEERR